MRENTHRRLIKQPDRGSSSRTWMVVKLHTAFVCVLDNVRLGGKRKAGRVVYALFCVPSAWEMSRSRAVGHHGARGRISGNGAGNEAKMAGSRLGSAPKVSAANCTLRNVRCDHLHATAFLMGGGVKECNESQSAGDCRRVFNESEGK